MRCCETLRRRVLDLDPVAYRDLAGIAFDRGEHRRRTVQKSQSTPIRVREVGDVPSRTCNAIREVVKSSWRATKDCVGREVSIPGRVRRFLPIRPESRNSEGRASGYV